MQKLLFILFAILFTGCFSSGQLAGTGYLVTVSEKFKTDWERVETTREADIFINKITGLEFETDSLLGKNIPFWDFRNDRFYIYVEKQQFFVRNNKTRCRWRAYDEFYNISY